MLDTQPIASQPALEVGGLQVNYGAIQAVHSLDLKVQKGEIVALIGPNGAGKTTSLMAIAGLLNKQGTVSIFGKDLSNASTEQIVRSGLTLSPEGRRVFSSLSVGENLRLGGAVSKNRAETEQRMMETFPKLKERYHQQAGTLSGGEQQMLAIARALMSEPDILLLDEPSLGLAPKIVDTIFQLVADLRDWGISVLMVEQDVEQALQIADRGYVMGHGRIQHTNTAAALLGDTDLKTLFFGERH